MYIGSIMHTDLITVPPEASLSDAQKLMDSKSIDHLLVVNKNKKLVGILSGRDLKQYWASPATSLSTHELNYLLDKVTAEMIMTKAVVTVNTTTTIERAAFIMQQHKISALPVMENGDLTGLITSTDVMGLLFDAIGLSDASVRLGVLVSDKIGELARVTDTLKDVGVNIQSLLCCQEKGYPEISHLVMRVAEQDKDAAIKALAASNIKVMLQYEKDISPFLP